MDKNKLFEKKISGETKYSGKLVTLETDTVELPDGNTAFREVIRKNGCVCIVPLTDDGEVVFVSQYRYPAGEVLMEVPAGKMEKGEVPLECAVRELKEETGYTAEKITPIGVFYPSPGIMDEVMYMYLATGLTKGNTHYDFDEFLVDEKMPLEDAVSMILGNKIPDGKTQSAVLKVWAMKQKNLI